MTDVDEKNKDKHQMKRERKLKGAYTVQNKRKVIETQ